MAEAAGKNFIVSIVKATTWGSAATVDAANALLRVKSWSYTDAADPLPDTSFNADTVNRESAKVGRRTVQGTFTFDAKYEGIETPYALMLGTAGVPSGPDGNSKYTHDLYRVIDRVGIFGSMAWDDGLDTHTIDSVKFISLKFSCTAGGNVQGELGWIGRARSEGASGGLSSVTEYSNIKWPCFVSSEISYQIATQAASLADVELMSWEVTLEHTVDDDDLAFTTTDAPYRRETVSNAFTCTGSITRPTEDTTYTAAVGTGALYKLKLNHTESNDEFGIWIPSLKFTSYTANPAGKGGIPQTLTFIGELAASTPSGFAYTVPYLRLLNARSTDPLA